MTDRITEAQHQSAILELAQLTGWRWYAVPDSRRCPAGWPDLVLVKGDRIIFAELKTDKGKLRRTQEDWLDALSQVREVTVRIWRPGDWPEIERMLGGRDGDLSRSLEGWD